MAEKMVKVANCRWEVTMDKIMKKAQFKGCERTLQRALRTRGIFFRPFREKLALTPEDIS